jgi:hypothetical protein
VTSAEQPEQAALLNITMTPTRMNQTELADAHVQTWRLEIRRQSQLVNEADKNDPWLQGLMEEAANGIEGWRAPPGGI